MEKYYKMLDIEKGSSQEVIKQAYRKQALLNHPDRHPDGDNEYYTKKFQDIGEAYSILSSNKEHSKENPYEIFSVFFPNINFNDDDTNIMIDKIINSNIFLEFPKHIWNSFKTYNLHKNLNKSKAKLIIMDYEISLQEQYISNTKLHTVNLKKRSIVKDGLINYTKTISLNLLNKKNIFENIGNYDLENEYSGDLHVNIIDKPDNKFKRYKDFDLIYYLEIGKDDLFKCIKYKITHFKNDIYINIEKPWTNLIYILEDYGMIDYSDNYKGDLYIKIIINPISINPISINSDSEFINPKPIDIFDC